MKNIEITHDNMAVVYPENFKNNARIGLRLDAGTWYKKFAQTDSFQPFPESGQ